MFYRSTPFENRFENRLVNFFNDLVFRSRSSFDIELFDVACESTFSSELTLCFYSVVKISSDKRIELEQNGYKRKCCQWGYV